MNTNENNPSTQPDKEINPGYSPPEYPVIPDGNEVKEPNDPNPSSAPQEIPIPKESQIKL